MITEAVNWHGWCTVSFLRKRTSWHPAGHIVGLNKCWGRKFWNLILTLTLWALFGWFLFFLCFWDSRAVFPELEYCSMKWYGLGNREGPRNLNWQTKLRSLLYLVDHNCLTIDIRWKWFSFYDIFFSAIFKYSILCLVTFAISWPKPFL